MKGAIIRAVLLLICCVQAAFGTSLRPLELRRVSSHLTVVVTHRQKPIAGIKVEVVPVGSPDPVFASTTDANGTVRIHGLMAGRYFLTASHEEFDAGKEWIEVVAVPNAKTKKRLNIQWADWSYQTRRVAGTLTGLVPGLTGHPLMDIVHPNASVFPGVAITLKSAFSDDERHTISDSSGDFLIDDVPDGIYILTIAGGMKSLYGDADVTRQVIDVMRSADREFLPLQLKNTGSGVDFELADN
jgi:Carboxypeptidase regulatory-like domain